MVHDWYLYIEQEMNWVDLTQSLLPQETHRLCPGWDRGVCVSNQTLRMIGIWRYPERRATGKLHDPAGRSWCWLAHCRVQALRTLSTMKSVCRWNRIIRKLHTPAGRWWCSIDHCIVKSVCSLSFRVNLQQNSIEHVTTDTKDKQSRNVHHGEHPQQSPSGPSIQVGADRNVNMDYSEFLHSDFAGRCERSGDWTRMKKANNI